MSRSYKKMPYCKVVDSFCKKQANKRVRKNMEISKGNNYKKVYNTYDIISMKSRKTYDEYLYYQIKKNNDVNNNIHCYWSRYMSMETHEFIMQWRRWFKNK